MSGSFGEVPSTPSVDAQASEINYAESAPTTSDSNRCYFSPITMSVKVPAFGVGRALGLSGAGGSNSDVTTYTSCVQGSPQGCVHRVVS